MSVVHLATRDGKFIVLAADLQAFLEGLADA